LRDGRLHVASVKAATPPEADAQAARIVAMLPPACTLSDTEGGVEPRIVR
jgi:hypothetical protein